MRRKLFRELVASVREGGAILRGEVAPSRKFVVTGPDVKCQAWRTPHVPVRILLQVAAKDTGAVQNAVCSGDQF